MKKHSTNKMTNVRKVNFGTIVGTSDGTSLEDLEVSKVTKHDTYQNKNFVTSKQVSFDDVERAIPYSLLFPYVNMLIISCQNIVAFIYKEHLISLLICPMYVFLTLQKMTSTMRRHQWHVPYWRL